MPLLREPPGLGESKAVGSGCCRPAGQPHRRQQAAREASCGRLVLEDPNAGSIAGHEFDMAADGQRGERACVSKVDVGHYR
jgi:hypothetical protein